MYRWSTRCGTIGRTPTFPTFGRIKAGRCRTSRLSRPLPTTPTACRQAFTYVLLSALLCSRASSLPICWCVYLCFAAQLNRAGRWSVRRRDDLRRHEHYRRVPLLRLRVTTQVVWVFSDAAIHRSQTIRLPFFWTFSFPGYYIYPPLSWSWTVHRLLEYYILSHYGIRRIPYLLRSTQTRDLPGSVGHFKSGSSTV